MRLYSIRLRHRPYVTQYGASPRQYHRVESCTYRIMRVTCDGASSKDWPPAFQTAPSPRRCPFCAHLHSGADDVPYETRSFGSDAKLGLQPDRSTAELLYPSPKGRQHLRPRSRLRRLSL